MILAIVGGRTFNNQLQFDETLLRCIVDNDGKYPALIISGGAIGADTMAKVWARKHRIPLKIHKPDWKKYGKSAGIRRNTDIIGASTHVIAFPGGKGTADSVKKAKKMNKILIEL